MPPGSRAAVQPRRTPRRATRRPLRWILLGLGLGILVLGAVLGLQARSAHQHLTAAAERIPILREQVTAGDVEAARATAEEFAADTSTARDAVHGLHWSAVAALPAIGPNVVAVQTVTASVDDLADGALPPLLDAAALIDPGSLTPRDGKVDLDPITRAAPDVLAADEVVRDSAGRLEALDTAELAGPLRGPLDELTAKMVEVRDLTGTAAKAVELLPPMLGADGPRRYLILTQNNAEPRALGGIPGAVILLRADDGRIELVEQRPAAEFGSAGKPVLRLSRVEETLFGTQLGRYMQNVTSTPDFPRAAQLAREMWRQKTGVKVDGVASIDPYALQLLLDATGPVRLPTGDRLTGDNAADVLLNQVYREIPDPAAQDRFFAAAAARIFEQVTSGAGDVRQTASALAEAAGQGRLLLWSAHKLEQAELVETPISGALEGKYAGGPQLGVYLHDRSGAKIAYYEHLDVAVDEADCDDPGSRRLNVSVTVSSQVPKNVAKLPDYLTGGGNVVKVGDIRTDVLFYAPTDGLITGFEVGDGEQGMTTHFHDGLQVAKQTVTIEPGESVTLKYDVRVPADLDGDLRVRTTPGPTDGQSSVTAETCGA